MQLDLSSDQEFFRETTARFLEDLVPVATVRELMDDPQGFTDEYWRRGAELGWTSLLVDEVHGGGSISGDGLADLAVIAHEFGAHAAPGPLLPTNVVAGALSSQGGDQHDDVLAGLLDGSGVATWAHGERRPHDHLSEIALTIRPDGDDLVLDGVKRPVESAGRAGHVLVTGRTGDGLTQVLVPTGTPGVTVRPLEGLDLTRRFSEVAFDGARMPRTALVGELGGADDQVELQIQQAIVIGTSESVGAMQAAFDMTLEWVFDRYSFGRPLASYQAIKHRMADMKVWLEASHGLADMATAAVSARAPEAPVVASAAKAYVGDNGAELLQDCVQLHGGIGVTFEHDMHLWLRRQAVNRMLYGTPVEHRLRITSIMSTQEAAA
jgi:alkylation response protein AidB-like acyl-CoA dehydrogenase